MQWCNYCTDFKLSEQCCKWSIDFLIFFTKNPWFLWWFVVRLLQTAYEELNCKYSLLQRSERDPGQAWDPKPHSCTPCMPKPSKSCAHLRYTEVKPDKVVPIRLHNFVAYERCMLQTCFFASLPRMKMSLLLLRLISNIHPSSLLHVLGSSYNNSLQRCFILFVISRYSIGFDQFIPAFTIYLSDKNPCCS